MIRNQTFFVVDERDLEKIAIKHSSFNLASTAAHRQASDYPRRRILILAANSVVTAEVAQPKIKAFD